MDYTIVLDNQWATMRYSHDLHHMYHTFKQPISGQSFRDVLDTGLATLKERGITRWLSDDRLNAEFPPDDVAWVFNDWIVRAAASGWKTWALVVPESVAARDNMHQLVELVYSKGVRVMVFTDVESAHTWLRQV